MAAIHDINLQAYQQVFAPYREELRKVEGHDGRRGIRFVMLFRQVIQMLAAPADINRQIPRPFVTMAHHYLNQQPGTYEHFEYEENRQFFLCDVLDWLERCEKP